MEGNKSGDFKVGFLDHAGEDVYRFKDFSLVITIGDDTTLVASDILYRFNIPIIGITDGDLDKVVESGFKSENSILFELESGFDDVIGGLIHEIIFENNDRLINSDDYKSISDLESKIIEIINNRNCKYTINKI